MQSANLLHSIFCFSVYLAQVISFAMFPYGLLSFGSGSFFVFESEAFQLASSAILVTARSAVMEAKMKIHSNSQELA